MGHLGTNPQLMLKGLDLLKLQGKRLPRQGRGGEGEACGGKAQWKCQPSMWGGGEAKSRLGIIWKEAEKKTASPATPSNPPVVDSFGILGAVLVTGSLKGQSRGGKSRGAGQPR